ncbi:MAG: trimethylamine methyltransferase family protein [Candidatus Eremiobacteraeota bacterium]|nr:trimethylamine methyltransferase family protein [Candidatus Eremiobacteraeota bacterium]
METFRPTLRLLPESLVSSIYEEALAILERAGVFIENEEAYRLLREAGMKADEEKKRVFITADLAKKSLASAPRKVVLYDVNGAPRVHMEGDRSHFVPGSAALNVLDPSSGAIRKPRTEDYATFSRVVNALEHIDAQSTSIICADVPEELADRYRLYVALHYCAKPVVTGTFREDAFKVMKDMLVAMRGSEEKLREQPLAIFDACPSPPLKWSHLTCQSVIDAARSGIPSEFISMPLAGATGPVTLVGSITQHVAETLSGVVISQLAAPGAPVIFGGSPSVFDMRKGTTPMGAIETMMIDASYAQVGKFLGLPTHAYMGLSDAKRLDYQGGLESSAGIMLAALTGINMISGAGMHDFESCQSIQKLVMDNEICGMAKRLTRGVEAVSHPMALDILMDVTHRGMNFLSHPTTLSQFRHEFYFPSPVIDRANLGDWEKEKRELPARIDDRLKKILAAESYRLAEEKSRALHEIMLANAKQFGLERLPALPLYEKALHR